MKCFLKMLAEIPGEARLETRGLLNAALIAIAGGLLGGCAVVPANQSLVTEGRAGVLKEVMARKDRIVHLSRPESEANKPVLLLLHGATDDPTEMMDIVQEWRGKYDVFMYCYNYHDHVQTVAADLVKEMKRLKANRHTGNMTVVTFSYSAIVFRAAVVKADDPTLFAGASLVQLVPTAGGSFLARGLEDPFWSFLVSWASKPSFAERPYGRFAEELWDGAGNKKFYEAIAPERMHTILIEGDAHSLATIKNKKVQVRYQNGIGPNVVVIPKSTGVTHDYFPTHPVGLAYLRQVLETLPGESGDVAAQAARDVPGINLTLTPPHPAVKDAGGGGER